MSQAAKVVCAVGCFTVATLVLCGVIAGKAGVTWCLLVLLAVGVLTLLALLRSDDRPAATGEADALLGPAPGRALTEEITEPARLAALHHAQQAARAAVRAGWAPWVVASACHDAALNARGEVTA